MGAKTVARRSRYDSPSGNLEKFSSLVQEHRDELLQEWRQKVRDLPAAQKLDNPTLNDHIPRLFDELALALRSGDTESVLDLQLHDSPKIHGGLRLRAGFDIVEVVAEYNILRELLSNIAERQNVDTTGDPNRILDRVIDRAVALAVDTYAKERALDIQQRREEHLSFLIHDLKTPLTAIRAAQQILERDLRALVENVPVQIINAVPENCVVFADPVLVTQVFQNLLSNAIKYTQNGG